MIKIVCGQWIWQDLSNKVYSKIGLSCSPFNLRTSKHGGWKISVFHTWRFKNVYRWPYKISMFQCTDIFEYPCIEKQRYKNYRVLHTEIFLSPCTETQRFKNILESILRKNCKKLDKYFWVSIRGTRFYRFMKKTEVEISSNCHFEALQPSEIAKDE